MCISNSGKFLLLLGMAIIGATTEIIDFNGSPSRNSTIRAQVAEPTPTPHMSCEALIRAHEFSTRSILVTLGERQIAVVKVPTLHPRCALVGGPRAVHALTQPYVIVRAYNDEGVLLSTYIGRLLEDNIILQYPNCVSVNGFEHYPDVVASRYDVTLFYQCCYSCQPNVQFTPMPTPQL